MFTIRKFLKLSFGNLSHRKLTMYIPCKMKDIPAKKKTNELFVITAT
jgi:hypothetical protein